MAIFGSKETGGGQSAAPVNNDVPVSAGGASRLGPGVLITGKVEGSEALRIDGRLEGEIRLEADLVVGPRAEIRATVHARTIRVEGRVEGDLSADQKIELLNTARVEGTLRAPRITVAEGAKFEGTVDMSMRK